MPTHFTPEALKFLRNLARHNDRVWFTPRKPTFDRELKLPMLALIDEINHELAVFAPDHLQPPNKAMLRIYRDTRFDASRNQPPRPYKTHISAWWTYSSPRVKLAKTSGAGFYFHLSAKELVIAAGVYMPPPEQLLAIRRYLADHYAELRHIQANRTLRRLMPDEETASLTRPPKGFSADHPAIDLIRLKQWGRSVTLPAEDGLSPTLVREIVSRFRASAPLVHLLNAPLIARPITKPLF